MSDETVQMYEPRKRRVGAGVLLGAGLVFGVLGGLGGGIDVSSFGLIESSAVAIAAAMLIGGVIFLLSAR
jgi:hypothetical protein